MRIIVRNKDTFMEKIASKDESTKQGYEYVILNFGNFCMERYANADYILKMKTF